MNRQGSAEPARQRILLQTARPSIIAQAASVIVEAWAATNWLMKTLLRLRIPFTSLSASSTAVQIAYLRTGLTLFPGSGQRASSTTTSGSPGVSARRAG